MLQLATLVDRKGERMNNEIYTRKKRFWAMILTIMLVITQILPAETFAIEYDLDYDASNASSFGVDYVYEGDVLNFSVEAYSSDELSVANIYYYDMDGKLLLQDDCSTDVTKEFSVTVKSYSGVSGSAMPAAQFNNWKITELLGSGKALYSLKLQATAYVASEINYELDGGTNAASNPNVYYEGKEKITLADATKSGYVFDGWYLDAAYTNKITSISVSQTGKLNIYAKFKIAKQQGKGSITVNDVFYGEAIKTSVSSDTNGTDNVTITYKKKGQADSYYTKTVPTAAGDYIARATFAETDYYYAAVATDSFSIKKREGKGNVSVDDFVLGSKPNPVVKSDTNGINSVTIFYKKANAADSTYSKNVPSEIGNYVVKAVFAATDSCLEAVATDTFSIAYLATPDNPYEISGTKGKDSYYTFDVVITPLTGYLIADRLGGNYVDKINISKSTPEFSVYLKKISTGEMTDAVKVPEIKIDKVLPLFSEFEDNETIYADEIELIVKDDNLNKVLVNENEIPLSGGQAVLKLSSNNGEETYLIKCIDDAGNEISKRIIVAAEWMKTKTIRAGSLKLLKKYSYSLGSGQWKVSGDDTVYSGNMTFYVDADGVYEFSNVE